MPELIFTSRGQAEALAAQEAIAKKARELKDEFESGAKSVGAWDANMAKLQRTSETALRSVQTEQEKIAEQISVIQERQEKGIGTTAENETAIARLRERWVELDEATQKQREATERVKEEHMRLKSSAEVALRSVQTEEEKVAEEMENIEEQIKEVEAAMDAGLIPPDEAKEGIKRLKDGMTDLEVQTASASTSMGTLGTKLKAMFDPTNIRNVKALAAGLGIPLGIAGAIKLVREQFNELQADIDRHQAARAKQLGMDPTTDAFRRAAGEVAAAEPERALSSEQRKALDEIIADINRTGKRRFFTPRTLSQAIDELEASQAFLADVARRPGVGAFPSRGTEEQQKDYLRGAQQRQDVAIAQLEALTNLLVSLRGQGGAAAALTGLPLGLLGGPSAAAAQGVQLGLQSPTIVRLIEEQTRLLADINRKLDRDSFILGTNE